MESLSWMFRLVDQMSGPAKKITQSLGGVAGGIKGAATKVKDFGSDLGAWAMKANAVIEGAAKVAKAFVEVGKKAYEFGKYVVESGEFKKQTLAGLVALEGGAKAADATLKKLELVGQNAGIDTKELAASFAELRTLGFESQEAFDAIAASLSVKAVHGDAKGSAALDLLKGIKSSGKFDAGALASVTKANLPVAQVKETLAKLKGVTVDEIDAMVASGQVSAAEGMSAILGTIHTTLDKGGGLGAAAKGLLGDTVGGQFQALLNNLRQLFGDSTIAEPLKRALKTLNDLLGEGSASGQRLRRLLGGALEWISSALSTLLSNDNVTAVFDGLVGLAETISSALDSVMPYIEALAGPMWDGMKQTVRPLIKYFKELFGGQSGGPDSRILDAFRDLGKLLGWIIGVVLDAIMVSFTLTATLTGALWTAIAMIVRAFRLLGEAIWDGLVAVGDFFVGLWESAEGLYDDAISLATDFIDGFIQGIADGWDAVIKKVTGLTDAVVGTVKKKLGIASPSKVMASMGMFTAIGFSEGVEANAPEANAAMAELASPPSPAMFTSASSNGSGGPAGNVSIGDINVHVPAGTSDAQAFGRVVGVEVRKEILRLFEELGLQVGVAPAA